MALKIRLRKQGRTNRPFYRLVVIDSRRKRDGAYLESVGWYNPVEKDEAKVLSIKPERIQHWLDQGAQLSENVENLVAKAAPEVIRGLKEKLLARQARETAKRRERKKKAA